MTHSKKLVLNRRDICAYIGEDANHFTKLVKKEQLPAYRTMPNGRWKARVRDLDEWLDRQARNYLRALQK